MIDYLKKQEDIIAAIRTVFVHSIWDYIPLTYSKTRDYENGLRLAEYLASEIAVQRSRTTKDEFERWDSEFIYFKLDMLNNLNRWQEYIEFFEQTKQAKRYCDPYGVVGKPVDDFKEYIVRSDKEFHYVHFLYQHSGQYEQVKKKFAKLAAGKKVGNLTKHQQDKLSDDEIAERLKFITGLLDIELAHLKRYGVPQNNV